MTAYTKSTVANLRKLLKERGIPSTGLTRKADIIAKLEEADQASSAPEATPAEAVPGASQSHPKEPSATQHEPATEEPPPAAPAAEASPAPQATETTIAPEAPSLEPLTEQPISATSSVTVAPEDSSPEAVEDTQLAPEVPESNSEATIPAPEPSQEADSTMKDPTPSSSPNEAPSVEKPEPVMAKPVDISVEASRLNTEELEADTRKRKRRSATPEFPAEKKARQIDNAADVVHLKEDDTVQDVEMRDEAANTEKPMDKSPEDINGMDTADLVEEGKSAAPEKKEKDARYKSLFQPAGAAPASTRTEIAPADDRPVAPAQHPATPAIYIRNFMRPLRDAPLRSHLVSLASPPSSSPDQSILKSLFLDSMRTHALALFTSTAAASRVRASLHGAIWPPERDRKELWVDFVPEDKVEGWIQQEEDAAREEKEARAEGRPTGPAKKWEVIYDEAPDGVVAVFQEAGAFPSRPSARNTSIPGAGVAGAPLGPRSPTERRRPSRPETYASAQADRKQVSDKSFQTLDTLFRFTTAKPKLYFLPVEPDLAKSRLDELDKETSRDWRPEDRVRGRGRGRLDEKRRFAFEGDRLVDLGFDFGPWAERRDEGFRGGRGGGGGGFGGRGGYRGRGGGWR